MERYAFQLDDEENSTGHTDSRKHFRFWKQEPNVIIISRISDLVPLRQPIKLAQIQSNIIENANIGYT